MDFHVSAQRVLEWEPVNDNTSAVVACQVHAVGNAAPCAAEEDSSSAVVACLFKLGKLIERLEIISRLYKNEFVVEDALQDS